MAEETPTGTLIQRARQRKRLTQQEMADALGVSKTTVANWESDKHFPLRYAGPVEELLGIVLPDSRAEDVPA